MYKKDTYFGIYEKLWKFNEKFGEPSTFTKFYQFVKKKKQFIFQRDITDTSCFCKICDNATLMAKAIQKEKKGHPTAPHDLVEKYSCDSSNANVENVLYRCRECPPTKILSGWDEASSSESSTEVSSSSDEESNKITHTQWTREDGKMKKSTKHVTYETLYREWEETVVGLKIYIRRKRVQVSRKHYLLQVRGVGGWLMFISGCFTPLRNVLTFEASSWQT